jgi:hypothetical protein
MIEIFQIIVQLLIFILLSYFPFNNLTTPHLFSFNRFNFNYFLFNMLFLIFALLIFSFIKIKLSLIFFFIITINIILLTLNFKKTIYQIFNKNNLSLKLFFFLINLLLFFSLAYNIELGYDGLQIWILKTNNFYNGYNYFESFSQLDNVKQYPHLGSYLWAFFWKNSLGDKEYFGRLFHIYLYVLSLFILVTSIKNLSEIKKIIILFLLLTFSFDIGLNGYQEYLMFSLIVFGTKLFTVIINSKKNNKIYYFLFVFNLIIICFVKNEGIFYAIFFCIIYYFFNKNKSKPIIFFCIILFIISFQLYISKILYKLESVFQFSITQSLLFNNDMLNIYEIAKRFIYINFYIVHSLLKYPINLINFIGTCIAIYFYKKIPENKFLLLFLILNIVFIFSIYLVTPFPFEWHLQTSIKRLFLQTSGLYFFIIINILNRRILKL